MKRAKYHAARHLKRSAFVIALSLGLTACADRQTLKCNIPSSNNPDSEQPLGSITPIIQIDRTISMRGFVKNIDSEYIQTLEFLDRTARALFSNSEPQYYGFWTERRKGGSLEEARSQDFYSSSFSDAILEQALGPLDQDSSDELSIIVTDLYRAKRDMKDVIKGFTNYLKQGDAIGILAIKSKFDGRIPDIFITNQNISHKGIRPFYVILLGRYENVAKYFEQLNKRKVSLIRPDYFIILNSQLVRQVSSFNIRQMNTELVSGVERVPEIYNNSLELELEDQNLIERLDIDNQAAGQQIDYLPITPSSETNPASESQSPLKKSNVITSYYPLPYTLPMAATLNIESCLYDEEQSKFDCQNSSNKSQFLEFLNLKINPDKNNGKISFSVKLLRSSLQDKVEKITVDVLPSQTTLPAWVGKWSFGEEDQGKSNDFYGSRTYNLHQLLADLITATNNEIRKSKDNSMLGRFCFAVHKI